MVLPPPIAMSEIKSPIVLVGGTTTGKSAIAQELADMTGGHIVNADKFYLYAGEVFMLGLGMERTELYDNRPRHLYGHLDPLEQPLGTDAYVNEASKVVEEIHKLGKLAIIDGCIRSYTAALIGRFGVDHAVRINCPTNQDLTTYIRQRGDRLISLGLYEETERIYDLGFSHAFPAREGFIYRPAIAAIRGLISKTEARSRMEKAGLELAIAQNTTYESMQGLFTVPHDRKQPEKAAKDIVARLSKKS
jgi:tRNA A37 N6-isopentenylltransferase MiaA